MDNTASYFLVSASLGRACRYIGEIPRLVRSYLAILLHIISTIFFFLLFDKRVSVIFKNIGLCATCKCNTNITICY